MESGDDSEVSIGLFLNELRDIRNYADYDFFKKRLKSIKTEFRIVSDQIKALKNSPPFDL